MKYFRPGARTASPNAAGLHFSSPRIPKTPARRATAILTAHRAVLDQLVALLVAEETVDGPTVYQLAGRPEPEAGGGVTVAPGLGMMVDRPSTSDAGSTTGAAGDGPGTVDG